MKLQKALPRPRQLPRGLLWATLVAALAAQSVLRWAAGSVQAGSAAATTPLYVSSGKLLRDLSLGYEGLLADIYWTRAVQYYGRERLSGHPRFDLLGPLLRITTTLDPHLIIAYRFGAVFLAEKPPGGAGQPAEALQLLRRGIVANPQYWRLWQDLGFIYYWDLHDYRAAARVFRAGSERPGAEIWMKTLAAAVAAKGGDLRTSQVLWAQIYRATEDETVRKSALAHLEALKAAQDLEELDRVLVFYEKQAGHRAGSLKDLVRSGLLGRLPLDPSGTPYIVAPDGKATLGPGSPIDLRLIH